MAQFWKPTFELYSNFIERPKMTQKLLVKPPFKYLFDIISQTTKKTGFGNGLYVGQELNGDYHSDKDKKILYLQKIIKLVQIVSGTTIEAKPQKIVAGLQPQILHKCATSGKNSDAAVNKVLGKAQPQPQKKQPKKIQRPPSAARIKKPQVVAPQKSEAPSLKKVQVEKQEEQEAPPPPQIKQKPAPAQTQKPSEKKQNYSGKVQQLMKQAQQQVVTAKQVEKDDGKKGINLGKLNKKKKDTSQKIISSGGQLTSKQLELTQSMIQSICQNTAPLGKSIQFINDDIEAMNKQLTFWRKQYNVSKTKTQSQLKLTQQALMPIYDKIRQVQQQIVDQRSKIQTYKAQIIKNDSVIRDLLLSVVTTK